MALSRFERRRDQIHHFDRHKPHFSRCCCDNQPDSTAQRPKSSDASTRRDGPPPASRDVASRITLNCTSYGVDVASPRARRENQPSSHSRARVERVSPLARPPRPRRPRRRHGRPDDDDEGPQDEGGLQVQRPARDGAHGDVPHPAEQLRLLHRGREVRPSPPPPPRLARDPSADVLPAARIARFRRRVRRPRRASDRRESPPRRHRVAAGASLGTSRLFNFLPSSRRRWFFFSPVSPAPSAAADPTLPQVQAPAHGGRRDPVRVGTDLPPVHGQSGRWPPRRVR